MAFAVLVANGPKVARGHEIDRSAVLSRLQIFQMTGPTEPDGEPHNPSELRGVAAPFAAAVVVGGAAALLYYVEGLTAESLRCEGASRRRAAHSRLDRRCWPHGVHSRYSSVSPTSLSRAHAITEALLLRLSVLAVVRLYEWTEHDGAGVSSRLELGMFAIR